jgi:tRNA threonylcarbamoyladenosine biosynthesis protein TsaB
MEFYMLVLALDTTTRRGSISLARDGAVLSTYSGNADITHGERLPRDLLRVVDAHTLRVSDIDVFAVASGPGSFTGLRIGIATMQGLALANEKSLVGISALDALNALIPGARTHSSALSPADEVSTWMDAQRGQVFSAVYKDCTVVEDALVDKPSAILSRWQIERPHPRVFIGDGALAYRDLIHRALPHALIVDPVPPLAPAIAQLAASHVERHGPVPPDAIRPVYIRRSDAELARDRKAGVARPV